MNSGPKPDGKTDRSSHSPEEAFRRFRASLRTARPETKTPLSFLADRIRALREKTAGGKEDGDRRA